MKLRPQYYHFDNKLKAEQFAITKNKWAKVHLWVCYPIPDNRYVVYNLRKDLM